MTRGIDQVEDVFLSRLIDVSKAGCLSFYGDSLLPLKVHRIQHLFSQLPRRKGPSFLQETIGKGGLPVIDVGNNRKIPNLIHYY